MQKNVKGGPFGLFQHSFRCKKNKQNEGGPLETLVNFGKKSLIVPKKLKGGHIVSSGF